MSTIKPDFSTNEKAYLRELEGKDNALVVNNILIKAPEDQKVFLARLQNTKQETLLHLLAMQILQCQDLNKDTSELLTKILEILKIKELKKELKNLVTIEDKEGLNLLDLAVCCRNDKFNFVHKILKLIPEEDLDQCKRLIDEEEFQEALNNEEDITTLLGLFHLSKDSQKTSLTRLHDKDNNTIFHLLGDQILEDQESDKDISSLIKEPLKILKKIAPEHRINIINAKNFEDSSFVDFAILCKNKKLNFMRELFDLIPIDDRDLCYRHIEKSDFKNELDDENLVESLNLFYLAKDSEKASLAKILNEKNMPLLHSLIVQIFKDLKNNKTTELLDQPFEVLKLIDFKARKDVINLKNSAGRNLLHLAALCESENYNLLYEILKLIPEENRAECLKIKDSKNGWTPLHLKANATTHKDDLNERSIQKILSLFSEEDKKSIQNIKDLENRTFQDIQKMHKKKEAFLERKKEDPSAQRSPTSEYFNKMPAPSKQSLSRKPNGFDFARRRRAASSPEGVKGMTMGPLQLKNAKSPADEKK